MREPFLARGQIRAAFGGVTSAPTVVIKAEAAFPVPCELGFKFRASGTILIRKLGGSVDGSLQMSAAYYCGNRTDQKLADFSAQLGDPIEIVGLMQLTKMSVSGTVFRKVVADNTHEDTGKGGGYFTKGLISGKVSILSRLEGLSIHASVSFDTSTGAAEVLASMQYVKGDVFALNARARIKIGVCDPEGTSMTGTVKLNAAPLAELSAVANIVRHCEEPDVATARHGHVWLIELGVPEVKVFNGALIGKNLTVKVFGRQVGITSSGMAWELEAGGKLMIGTGEGLPSALMSVDLHASFHTKLLLRSGQRTKKTDVPLLGGSAGGTGMTSFDVNATTVFEAGHDPKTKGPIFGITAVLNFSYPCTRPVGFVAVAYIHNLGGELGLTVDEVNVQLVLYVNAGPEDVQLSFKATMPDIKVNGHELGTVDILANAFLRPNTTGNAALGSKSDKSSRWYWKGMIQASVSLAASGAVDASAGAQFFFNTLTNTIKVIATAKFHFENDLIVLDMEGETSSACREQGTFVKGQLDVKPDAGLPFSVPSIKVSANKFCKPYLANVYAIRSSLSLGELAEMNDGVTTAMLGVRRNFEHSPDEGTESYTVKLALPASHNVHSVMSAMHEDMVASNMRQPTSDITRAVTLVVTVHAISMQTWSEMKNTFIREMSTRLDVDPEDIRITPSNVNEDVELVIKTLRRERTPFSEHDSAMSASRHARLGDGYGISGSLSRAAHAANVAPPEFTVSSHEAVVNIATTATSPKFLRDGRNNASLGYVPSHNFQDVLELHGLSVSDMTIERSTRTPALGNVDVAMASTPDADPVGSDAMKFGELTMELIGAKLAATDDGDDMDNFAWELKVSGSFNLKDAAGGVVPSFFPQDIHLDIAYVNRWHGKNLDTIQSSS